LPASTVTLTGTATGNGGATISAEGWTELSGPVTASPSAASSLTTGVSGLTTAGAYVFQLKATDNNGLSGTSTVTITVDAAVPPPPPVPPTVSAGNSQTITLPASTVTLTGTATGNGGATISAEGWTELSGPVTASLSAASSLTMGVSGLTTAGAYVFQLKATDNNGLSGTSTVTITVDAAGSTPPVANAGSSQTVMLPVTELTLDGSGSYDPGGTIVSYSWVQLSGDGGVTIVGSNTVQPKIYGLTAGTYVFQLTVTDSNGLSSTSTVTITVDAGAPVANAGVDTTIALPASTAQLNGSGSSDPSGEMLTYQWTEVSGPGTAGIAFSNEATTAVSGLQSGLYVFELLVTNSSGLSDTATVQVRVENAQRTANQGNAQVMVYPNPVEEVLHIRFMESQTSGQVLLRLCDMKGTAVLLQETTISGGGEEATFNVSGLARGTYVLQVTAGPNSSSYQLIVKQ
jgi:hypothetical protein